MKLTKTTFELDPALLVQLKATAAHSGKSVRALLTEGAHAVLEKYSRLADQQTLDRRAKAARERMRRGYGSSKQSQYDASNIDTLLYAADADLNRPAPKRRRK